MHVIWLKFLLCLVIILIAGKRVAKYADVIAEKTNLSGLWIGLILVSISTSLPELFTGVGSVVFVGAPDITVGNLMGANSYNLLNLCVLDFLHKGAPLLSSIGPGQILTAALSLIPLLIAILGIIFYATGHSAPVMWGVGLFSAAIFAAYCVTTKILYKFEKKENERKKEESLIAYRNKYDDIPVKKAYIYYGIAATLIIMSGIWLSYIGKELSDTLNLGESFVGSLFIGFATTLPEITVSIAAMLIGAKEIAVANMLGSNLFNMTIIFIDDILYRKAPILEAVSPVHVRQGVVVAVMTAVVILAMAAKAKKKVFGISWYTPVLAAIFIIGAYINFIK